MPWNKDREILREVLGVEMNSEPKLDPCPFCGAKYIKFSRYDAELYCYCNECGSRGINISILTAFGCECHTDRQLDIKNEKTVDDALIKVAAAWNKRIQGV